MTSTDQTYVLTSAAIAEVILGVWVNSSQG
jgi:hypothetical protein